MIEMHQTESIQPYRAFIHHRTEELRLQKLIEPLLGFRIGQFIKLLQIHHRKLSYEWEDGDIYP